MEAIQQLRLLINLARADGEVARKERQFIINIGQANHLLVTEILPLFSDENPAVVPAHLSDQEKFEFILHLMQLMKIDEKLYKEEMKYFAEVASKLGYKREVLFELILQVKAADMDKNELESLRKLTETYLRPSRG
jgi:uncharacterized tellurite resistance protein B-like protein